MVSSYTAAYYDGPKVRKNRLRTKTSSFVGHFIGTFCFPFANGFGCGAELSIRQGQKISLSTNLGIPLANVASLGVTFGKEYDSAIEWRYKSRECEYCRPEICYPHSSVTVWDSQSNLFKSKPKWIETDFRHSTPAEINNNCVQNDKRCNCIKSESDSTAGEGGRVEYLENPSRTVVMTPYDFDSDSKTGGRQEFDALDNDKIESTLFNSESNVQNNELGVLNPSGHINWIYPRSTERQEISLLLRKPTDYLGANLRTLKDGIFPILAVSQELRKSTMEGSLTIEGSRDSETQESTAQVIRTIPSKRKKDMDLLSAFYMDFDLPNKLKDKDKIQLKLKLRGEDEAMKAYLLENFVIQQ